MKHLNEKKSGRRTRKSTKILYKDILIYKNIIAQEATPKNVIPMKISKNSKEKKLFLIKICHKQTCKQNISMNFLPFEIDIYLVFFMYKYKCRDYQDNDIQA